MKSRRPTTADPSGAPSPFEKQTETLSNGAAIARAVARGSPPSATAALKRRRRRDASPGRGCGPGRRGLQVVERQDLAADRVLEAEQAALREVRVVRLDRRLDPPERQPSVGLVLQRLRLHAAEHRRAAAFPAIGVRHLADDVLVAAAAVVMIPTRLLCVPLAT
jgi:hypothetical protein